MTRLARILVLICGLPLLLPPCWCCSVRAASPTRATPAAKTCCPCKKCQRHQPEDPKPAEPPSHCPCLDRAATAPSAQKIAPVDWANVSTLPDVVASMP